MIAKVMEKYPITLESVLKHTTSSKSIFKQHIMRALFDYGYTLEFYGDLDRELFNPKTGQLMSLTEKTFHLLLKSMTLL